jgi:hypothetical protein
MSVSICHHIFLIESYCLDKFRIKKSIAANEKFI